MSNLFELKDSYQQVYDLIAEQEDEQILKDTLSSINDAIEDKADGYVAVIKSLEADNNAIDEEIKRLRQRKTSNQNGVKRLKESLQEVMEQTEKRSSKLRLIRSIANNPPSLDVTDESLIPKQYYVEQQPKLDAKHKAKQSKSWKERLTCCIKDWD